MKKLLFTLVFSVLFFTLSAQDYEIVSVESLPADMSAREEMKADHNDRQCALLRIATQNITPEQRERFTFKPDLGSEVVDRANRNGEILLWVSPGLKYLLIMHRDWGQYELRLPDYVARIEALHTYKVTIKGTFTVAPQAQSEVSPTQQYLVFQLTPTNATLEVDDQLWSVDDDGTAMKYVNFGTYTYRVRASDYYTETGKVTVDDPNNTKMVPVSLKPNFATITLQVDANAEIWVNNVKKGIRSWTGPLGNGTYKIECKEEGHETTMISKEIDAGMDGQTITLPEPMPIYGSLNVESTPNLGTIFIDDIEYGKTPKAFYDILVGQHSIRIKKDGYVDYDEVVTITKGDAKQIKATLQKDNSQATQNLTNTNAGEALVEEAYLRKLKDIRASHILIRCDKNGLPSDTLKAYNMALDIRKKALQGEDFGELAVQYSEDPSARDSQATDQASARPGNKGDLGYFTVFDMVYPFETGAYNTKEGEISMPVRTDFGYHIIKVTSITDAMGTIQAAHIFIQLPNGASEKDETAALIKANEIYNKLIAKDGKNWNEMVKQYSDDKGTIERDGILSPFTVSRIVPEFVETCKSLEIGQISKPVRTNYGYHIIKLLNKSGVGSFDEEYNGLCERIKKDMRSKKPE